MREIVETEEEDYVHDRKGVTGKPLVRHTPTLWNLAWSPLLFWDGRAASLEEQIRFPVEHPDEMGSSLENGVARLSRHESYVQAFAQAFPQDPRITPDNIARALAPVVRAGHRTRRAG